jgi:hypothetical protein
LSPKALTIDLKPASDAGLPTPPERAPKEGTFAGFASFKNPPPAGSYTISLSKGAWIDVVQDGHLLKPKAFSAQAEGVQRSNRLRRYPQDHEVRSRSKSVRAADQRHPGKCPVGDNPALGIAG